MQTIDMWTYNPPRDANTAIKNTRPFATNPAYHVKVSISTLSVMTRRIDIHNQTAQLVPFDGKSQRQVHP